MLLLRDGSVWAPKFTEVCQRRAGGTGGRRRPCTPDEELVGRFRDERRCCFFIVKTIALAKKVVVRQWYVDYRWRTRQWFASVKFLITGEQVVRQR